MSSTFEDIIFICLYISHISHSECSDECIDFTMMCCFFLLHLHTRRVAEKMLRFSILKVPSDSKLDLVVLLRGKN